MTKVLVVYGSRHGATQGIAERIGDVLARDGNETVVSDAEDVTADDVLTADAFVVGSGVYMGRWLKEPLAFLDRHRAVLGSRPTWLFSSGPLPGSSKVRPGTDPLTNALGPTVGAGSGGRKKVDEVSAAIQPRDHRVFSGAFHPDDPPVTLSERLVRMLPVARKVLPAGDFRDWDAIDAWAEEIGAELSVPVPAG